MKLDKLRRRAASRVILNAALMLSSISNVMLTFNHLEWGDDLFTENEKAYLTKVRDRIHHSGEALRLLGAKLRA